jgi:hypothetical protein
VRGEARGNSLVGDRVTLRALTLTLSQREREQSLSNLLMTISLALSIIAIASGTLLTYTWDKDAPLASRLCTGTCVGFALLGLIGFILALLIGLTGTTLVLTALLMATPALLLRNPQVRTQIDKDFKIATIAISRATTRPDRWAFIYFFFYAAVAIVMWLVFSRAMFEKPEGIYTGVLNNYGDLPFHLSVITRFAFGQNFPPEDPTFAGARFTYPFMTDFISAMFVRAGASLRDSLFIENYFVGVALVGVLHRFGQKLLRNRTAAILTPLLIILNGGLGWAMLFKDVNKTDGGVVQVLSHIPHSYTILPEVADGWRWGNAVTSLLIPQRGFLLGIPLAVIVFTQCWAASHSDDEVKRKKVKGKKEERRDKLKPATVASERSGSSTERSSPFSFLLSPSSRRMLAAGVVAGLLPLIHAHTFIAVMLVAAFLVPWIYRRGWAAYGVAALVALLLYSGAIHFEVLTPLRAKVAIVAMALGLAGSLFWLLPMSHLRIWVCFFVLALGIGGPQIIWSTRGSAVKMDSFLAWKFGWDSDQQPAPPSVHPSVTDLLASLGPPVEPKPLTTAPPIRAWMKRLPYVVWFWLKNTGLFIPLLIVALLWKRDDYLVSRKLLFFFLPFTLCFIIPNLVKLAPWIWDNVKILFYWWIASAPIVALLLARLWKGKAGNRVLAGGLVVVLTLAGALDVFALMTSQGEYQEFDRDGVTFAEMIKQQTPPRATILHAPVHNTPLFLTGRRSLMGYPGHIWTHGIDFGQREADIKKIYLGSPDAESLLDKYGVDYVVIDPQEISVIGTVNTAFFSRYPEVVNIGEYHLYKIKP